MTGESDEFMRYVANNTYEIKEQIGTGGFGVVLLARLINTESFFALKVCSLRTHLQRQTYDSEVLFGNKFLQNKRTAHLIDHYTFTFEKDTYGVLCYERMEIDLMDYILETSPLTEKDARKVFYKLCKSIKYLHSHSVAHLDLKPENILLNFSPSKKHKKSLDSLSSLKLCDFGFMQQFNKGQKICIDGNKGFIGTKEYRSPEIQTIKKRFGILPKQFSFYAEKADIWSLGICLYVMLTGYFPYRDVANQSSGPLILDRPSLFVLMNICEDNRAFQLVQMLLQTDPLNRPSIEEILEDDWFDEIYDEKNRKKENEIDIDRVDDQIENWCGIGNDDEDEMDSFIDKCLMYNEFDRENEEEISFIKREKKRKIKCSKKRKRSKSFVNFMTSSNSSFSLPSSHYISNSSSLPDFVVYRANSKVVKDHHQIAISHFNSSDKKSQ